MLKIYVFAGSKTEPDWYYTECKLSKPYFKFDIENKRLRCIFFADNTRHLGAFLVLTLKQMIVLPFLHRLYYSEKRAKRRQNMNWDLKEKKIEASFDVLHKRPEA